MNDSKLSFEFALNIGEIHKLNKMYFKNLWETRVRFFLSMLLIVAVFFSFFNLNKSSDYIVWIIRNLALIIIFLLFQYLLVKTASNLIFQLIKRLLKFENFIAQYKLNFTNSLIYVHSPLGEITHKWSQIDKVILTKDFFLLYIKEKNGYIISISNKCNENRNIEELIAFVERKVTHITKVY
ncbi:YcxB family protein [Flavobacterium sp. KACC 22761]|uniref:YcxB family protein n=1 Tax=Flavobacterium sp. KACC 22761 TaxID=3092665 RepID=UPI002A756753|nr:YcxB family protein [Flavobacterium sp. KACC 22761]WPO78469.1 YcxB family protein [Flavobacterium sp. KACC 22761]